ncbi:MAG: SMC-Scp complex subunit ScpB [Candidatus Margulisbacteria bacterium]|jgi:segregation and condensation protein B|nr:SMC-Scp complex subunit ScpB [Candidatus Margulisiibacteriota bacterium]
MEPTRIKNILESLLFVAREPLAVEQLEEMIGVPRDYLGSLLEELVAELQGRGIQVFKLAGGYLMGTNPENVAFVEKILHPKEETRLSAQALETLAIIAYKQPVTRVEIERIRGVDSGWVIDSLVTKKLVKEVGRSEAIGRPYIYATSEDFMRHFGLKDLASLPPLPSSEADQETIFKSALQETANSE